jgi:hypothetical protein
MITALAYCNVLLPDTVSLRLVVIGNRTMPIMDELADSNTNPLVTAMQHSDACAKPSCSYVHMLCICFILFYCLSHKHEHICLQVLPLTDLRRLDFSASNSTLHTGTAGIAVMEIASEDLPFGLNASYWDRWDRCHGDRE